MLHAIDPDRHGPLGRPMTRAIEACVHCGFCLAACPTYRQLGQEMDSPRGRIVLMKQVLEGSLDWTEAQPHIDRCLGCLACEPACPSGVAYRDLIGGFRSLASAHFPRSAGDRLRRALTHFTLPNASRFRWALRAATLARAIPAFVPAGLRPMLELAPTRIPPAVTLPECSPAHGPRRARVALLAGCAQQTLEPDINLATIEVLNRNGVEVLIPRAQVCCGSLAWHTGNLAAAREFAAINLNAFPSDLDGIVTNAAGCGSTLQEYHHILRGTADEDRAEAFRHRVLDVSVFLARLGLSEEPAGFGRPVRVAYQDACHLANAQGVRQPPRDLLRAIPGLELLELADADLCCGSAGTYNLDQPAIAAPLGEQKARAVQRSGADILATGNIGCLTQIALHLRRRGATIPVRHTFQILRDAYPAK